MAGQYTSSASQGQSSSYAQQTPQSQFAIQVGQAAYSIGLYLANWAQSVYAQTSAITDNIVNNFLNYAGYAQGLAQTQLNTYTNQTIPEMNTLAQEAATYASPARISLNMGQAAAGAYQAGAAGNQNTLQTLRGYGVDPSSGMYGDILAAQNTATGASEAGAAEQAGINTENTGRTLLQSSITAGQQLPGDIVNSLNLANNAVTGAENAVLSNANTGATLATTPAPFFNAAMSIKNPTNASQSTQQSKSSSVPGGGGGGSGSNNQFGKLADLGFQGAGDGGAYRGRGPSGLMPGSGNTNNFMKTVSVPPSTTPGMDQFTSGETTFGAPDANGGIPNDPFSQQFQNFSGASGNPAFTPDNPNQGNFSSFGAADTDGNVPTYNSPAPPGWTDPTQGPSTPTNWDGSAGNQTFNSFNDYTQDTSTPSQQQSYDPNYSDPNNYAQNYSQGNTSSDGTFGGGGFYGGYAKGGVLPAGKPPSGPTTGGFVPRSASPSGGRMTDDIPARLNADEFVIPRDVTKWKGQEFFHKLIADSRKRRVMGQQQSGAQGAPKPPLSGPPRFVSQSMGAPNGG